MENKKIIKVVVIIFAVIIAFALIEILIKFLLGVAQNMYEKSEERKQEEIEYNSDASKSKRQVTTFLDNIISAIKEKDYSYIMTCLDDNYKQYMFNNNIEELKTHIEKNYNIEGEYEYQNIDLDGGIYQVTIKMPNNNSKTFTVNILGENNCSLFLGNYTAFMKRNEIKITSDLTYNVSYYYETSDLKAYVVDVKNTSSGDINISFSNASKLVSYDGRVFTGSIPARKSIKSGEITRIEFKFLRRSLPGSYIQFDITKNDVKETMQIDLSN